MNRNPAIPQSEAETYTASPVVGATQVARDLYVRAFGCQPTATYGNALIAFTYGDHGITHFRSWMNDEVMVYRAQIGSFSETGVNADAVVNGAIIQYRRRP